MHRFIGVTVHRRHVPGAQRAERTCLVCCKALDNRAKHVELMEITVPSIAPETGRSFYYGVHAPCYRKLSRAEIDEIALSVNRAEARDYALETVLSP